MRKALVMCILAISITLMVNVKVYADEPTPTPTSTPTPTPYQIMQLQGNNVNLASLYYYYNEVLNTDQKNIVWYLTGSYNYMYMRARGFNYNDISASGDLVERILNFGNKFWENGFENASRYNSTFQNYLQSIVNYAGTVNVDVFTWLSNNTDDFYLPYSVEGLEAWTTFYNDPSNEGIENWGYEVSPWVSGIYYSYELGSYPFASSTHAASYNTFMNTYTNIVFTSNNYSGSTLFQNAYSFDNLIAPDTLCILDEGTGKYQYYKYTNGLNSIPTQAIPYIQCKMQSGYVMCDYITLNTRSFGTVNTNQRLSLSEIVDNAFQETPFNATIFKFWYPYIEHVYLVDSLDTLSNPREVTNSSDMNIDGSNATWIQMPNGQILLNPRELTLIELDPNRFFDILKKDDGEGNLIPIDPDEDLTKSIVNNTVINNFDIVAPGVVINVPVNWFDTEGNYLDYTYQYSLPFFSFIGDVFLSLGEIRVFILGCIIILLVGGVIGKFLL